MSKHLICAIDTSDFDAAFNLARELSGHVAAIKLGLEFFSSFGVGGVEKISSLGVSIFLDLKLHDIPNTVYKTCLALKRLNVFMFTVHTAGGREMLERSVLAFKGTETKVVGVTILTSGNADNNMILERARLAANSGLHGVVCAGNAIKTIRSEFGKDLLVVTPGIRFVDDNIHDHKQSISPKKAIELGADYIVMGRPITEDISPLVVVKKVLNHMYI